MISVLLAAPALAGPKRFDSDRMPQAQRYERMVQARVTPAQAKKIALSRVRGGEVVDIRRSGDSYRVRVIARDGRVVDIVVDAQTGRVR